MSAFSIDAADGKLALLNRVSTRGPGPCHLALNEKGTALIAANYGGGSVVSFPVGKDGKLGEAATFIQHTGSGVDRQRQRGPHAHCAVLSPDQRLVLVADLGLDQIVSYRLDANKATLAPADPPFTKIAPGSGPRHLHRLLPVAGFKVVLSRHEESCLRV